jgi:hypothetical protein
MMILLRLRDLRGRVNSHEHHVLETSTMSLERWYQYPVGVRTADVPASQDQRV